MSDIDETAGLENMRFAYDDAENSTLIVRLAIIISSLSLPGSRADNVHVTVQVPVDIKTDTLLHILEKIKTSSAAALHNGKILFDNTAASALTGRP